MSCLRPIGGPRPKFFAGLVTISLLGALLVVCASSADAVATGSQLSIFAGRGSNNDETPGPATSSSLGGVTSLAADGLGNVFMADPGGRRVVKVNSVGILSYFAGTGTAGPPTAGPATASQLQSPAAIAVDPAGNVFIADTVAGLLKVTPSGELSIVDDSVAPMAVAVDSSNGELYYNASNNDNLIWVDSSLGTPQIVETGYPGTLVGLAVNRNTHTLYISAYSGNVSKRTRGGAGIGTVSLVSSSFESPLQLATDPDGSLYVIDSSARVVEKITTPDSSPVLTRFAGGGSSGLVPGPALNSGLSGAYGGPRGVTVDPSGNVYIADSGRFYVEKVSALTPSEPISVSGVAGDSSAAVTFTIPLSSGSSAITGYDVSTDDGSSWTPVSTSGSSPFTVTVSGLVNGTTYQMRVRANNASLDGNSSAAVSVTPVASPTVPVGPPVIPVPPGVPSAPSAVAGTASVTVSWSPPTPSTGVTGYTVSASPGPATCSTFSVNATTCVVGAVTGTSYTYTVVAHSAGGDSAASGPSSSVKAPAPPVADTVPDQAPTTLTTPDGVLATVVPSQPVTVVGNGFAPYSTAKVVIYSDPIVLATVTTNGSGGFSAPVVVPARLDLGAHNFVASGVDPAGVEHLIRMPVTLVADTSPDATAPLTVKVVAGNKKLAVTFAPAVARAGLTITGYQVSVDGGKHWTTVHLPGTTRLKVTIAGLTNGHIYPVRVRALTSARAGSASATVKAKPVAPWFHDPITAAGRKGEAAVPAHPGSYRGRQRTTKAAYRSHNGTLAVPASWVKGHRLAVRQAATLTGGGLFDFDSAAITKAGSSQIKTLAASLTADRAVTCEGYTDYAGSSKHEKTLSLHRARAVCAALKSLGAKAVMHSVGYGGTRPVTIGGTDTEREANRRVVVLVTK